MVNVNKQLELELEFIAKLSCDLALEFTKSTYFQPALTLLAKLLKTNVLTFTSIYKDNNNQESQLRSYIFAENNQKSSNLVVSKFNFFETPEFFKKLISDKKEIKTDPSELLNCLFKEEPPLKIEETFTGTFYAVPFFSGNTLVGIISYQAENAADIENNYVAAYHLLNAVFTNDYRFRASNIENKTYQTVLDLMPQRVFWKNRQSMYLGCNKAFSDDATLSGPDKIVGVTDFDIFPEQAELYRSDDANTMESRKHLISSEEPQTHQDGKTIWLRTSKRPIITTEDIVIGLVGTYDDITPLKNTQHELNCAKQELEERVQQRTKELTESNSKLEQAINQLKTTQNHLVETEKMAALGSLVAGVAHEINTPLGVAVTGASTLSLLTLDLNQAVKDGTLSRANFHEACSDIVKSSDLVLRNLERAAELIKNFKMIAVDQSNDEKRKINLNRYMHDIVNAMTPKTNRKNIKIFLEGDENLFISTFPGTIAQIITNLIDNTMVHAFTHKDCGEIKIVYRMEDKYLKLTFQDDGEGISPNLLTKIFQPFYTSKRGKGGSGLGLSIVYNLVTQRLNGQILCESQLNEWTRFTLTIPVKK